MLGLDISRVRIFDCVPLVALYAAPTGEAAGTGAFFEAEVDGG